MAGGRKQGAGSTSLFSHAPDLSLRAAHVPEAGARPLTGVVEEHEFQAPAGLTRPWLQLLIGLVIHNLHVYI